MISVLIVDDPALLRASLRSRLSSEPDLAVVNESGTAAQAIVKGRAVQPDLVLLGVVLPDGNGCQAVPERTRVAPRTRVLMISAQTVTSSVRQALSAGAVGYVSKHASDDELLGAIRQVAAGEEYVEPALGAKLVLFSLANGQIGPS